VSKNPDQATYNHGDVVELTATPVLGWGLAAWSGDLSGNVNPISITMDSNKVVTAQFLALPLLISPSNGEGVLTARPTFDWSDVPGATNYTLVVSRNSNFRLPVINVKVTSSSYTSSGDLPRGVMLYWHVKANGVTFNWWSETRTLTTANPPYMPVLMTPVRNALVTDYTPLFDWRDARLPAGTTFQKYELQLDTNSAFTSAVSVDIVGAVTNSQYTPTSDLNPNTTYYWRVRVYNTNGEYSNWSTSRAFRTAILPPTLLTPLNLAILTTLRPILDWEDVVGASGYTLQVSRNDTFTQLVLNKMVTSSTYTPTVNLPANVTLYWRVRANGVNGPSQWSEVRSFTIQ
jgi:hypothetical protein